MKENDSYKVQCDTCGKTIYRTKKVVKNKYGTWKAKCDDCKKTDNKGKQTKRIKERYRDDMKFRQKVIDRSKDRYWKKRVPLANLTVEEKQLLAERNSYPVLGPGCLGTSELTTNYKIVIVDNVERIKGAIFLEEYRKKAKKS